MGSYPPTGCRGWVRDQFVARSWFPVMGPSVSSLTDMSRAAASRVRAATHTSPRFRFGMRTKKPAPTPSRVFLSHSSSTLTVLA